MLQYGDFADCTLPDCNPVMSLLCTPLTSEALWRSGDAADCKSVYAGSIPAGASNLTKSPPEPGVS